MTIELLFLAALLLFFVYCFFYIGMVMPASPSTELGAEQWPQLLLGLLILLLIVNIVQTVKRDRQCSQPKIGLSMLSSFFKSKLFVAFMMVIAMALLLEYIGFIPTAFLFLTAYGYLLGERKAVRLIVSSLVITVILYLLFSVALSIMLPRGYGVFREFALWVEML